jgi:hypothetical protein
VRRRRLANADAALAAATTVPSRINRRHRLCPAPETAGVRAAAGAAVGMVGGAAATAALARRCLGFGPFSLPEVRNLLKQSLIRRMRPSGP